MVNSSAQDKQLLKNLYNAFDPFRPLPPGDPTYVDCREVRGDGDILEDLGNRIELSDRKTCQLYSGHRGAGKSTELLKLKQALEEQKFYVVYFGEVNQPGLDKIKDIIAKRVNPFTTYLDINTEIFDSLETFNQLCLMSGGHMRNLLLLTQDAIARTKQLPISQRAVRRAITEARNTYRQTVEDSQWDFSQKYFVPSE